MAARAPLAIRACLRRTPTGTPGRSHRAFGRLGHHLDYGIKATAAPVASLNPFSPFPRPPQRREDPAPDRETLPIPRQSGKIERSALGLPHRFKLRKRLVLAFVTLAIADAVIVAEAECGVRLVLRPCWAAHEDGVDVLSSPLGHADLRTPPLPSRHLTRHLAIVVDADHSIAGNPKQHQGRRRIGAQDSRRGPDARSPLGALASTNRIECTYGRPASHRWGDGAALRYGFTLAGSPAIGGDGHGLDRE